MPIYDGRPDDPLSYRFFLEGREEIYYISLPDGAPDYASPDDVLKSMIEKLGAIADASPISSRLIIAKKVADYVTETSENSKLFDLIRAIDKVYEVLGNHNEFRMADGINSDKADEDTNASLLRLALQKVEFLAATGRSKILTREEEESFSQEMDEENTELARLAGVDGPKAP